ncbi:hypothetical protein DFP72DRAFT_854212 [Ephemerocybe angulata]|uniref:Secreted protein n=1 Tax=Ephemerocybe angulata TaxID=980116 RepID=A0A8H6HJS9_9AGAR|nr:hypothetical protein DFP72DRAFT_854212 [Tulosesus angulatus]
MTTRFTVAFALATIIAFCTLRASAWVDDYDRFDKHYVWGDDYSDYDYSDFGVGIQIGGAVSRARVGIVPFLVVNVVWSFGGGDTTLCIHPESTLEPSSRVNFGSLDWCVKRSE